MSAAVLVLYCLIITIPADFSTVVTALQQPDDGGASKLTLLNFDLDFTANGVFTFGLH